MATQRTVRRGPGQLADPLAGRYPLSKAKVIRLRAFLDHPPPVVQLRLL